MKNLVFGIFGVSDPGSSSQSTLREITISWSRYGYQAEIIEAIDLDELLQIAVTSNYEYIFVQKIGNLIDEQWRLSRWGEPGFYESLEKHTEEGDFLCVGQPNERNPNLLRDNYLLVNLIQYKALQQPPVKQFIEVCRRNSLPVKPFSQPIKDTCIDISGAGSHLRKDPQIIMGSFRLDNRSHKFFHGIDQQAKHAQNGVFLFNIESYEDLTDGLEEVDAIFGVAAGFKTNKILEFSSSSLTTPIVYFDYSRKALEIKKYIVETWNGEDFPAFVKKIFNTYPSSSTFYQLWFGATTENINTEDLNWIWEGELQKWGGANAFKNHWRRYQMLPHEYIHCNLLGDTSHLLHKVGSCKKPYLWWSNAFFTVYSNWYYSLNERKTIYTNWLQSLVVSNPACRINGSDYNNSSVNGLTIAEYLTQMLESNTDELHPLKCAQTEIHY